MTKARILANLISDNAELADGQISVAEVVGAAPLASPTFTGTTTISGDFNAFNDNGGSAIYDFKSDHYSQIQLTSDVDNSSSGGPYTVQIVANGNNGGLELRTNAVQYMGIEQSGNVTFNEYSHDADFRVESDSDTNMLFVDAGNNRVSVGGGGPQARLNVFQNLNNSSDWWTNTRGALYLQNLNSSGHTVVKFNNETNTNASIVFNSTSSSGFQLFDRTSVEERLGVDSNELVINEGSQNFDFRVESNGNSNMLFVDAGNDRVGIGVTPRSNLTLDVAGDIGQSWIDAEQFVGQQYSTGGYRLGIITDSTDRTAQLVANAGDLNGKLEFYVNTNKAGAVSSSSDWTFFEGATFNENGSDKDFRVESNNNANMLFVDAGADVVCIGTNSPDPNGGVMMVQTLNTHASGPTFQSTGTTQLWLKDSNATSNTRLWGFQNSGGALNFLYADDDKTNNFRTPMTMYRGSTGIVINEDSLDQDFRVESNNNANMLKVDAGANQVVVGSAATVSNLALRVAGTTGSYGGNVANTASGSSRTLDIPISDLGGGRGTYLVSYYAYANGGDRQAGFIAMMNVMTSPDRAAGTAISERYATVDSLTYSGSNVRIVFTATGGYTHQGATISLLKLA